MKLCEASRWDEYVANNTDGYGKGIIDYAEAWANLMERRMALGATLEDCAKQASHDADTDGITGFMYGAAVQTLATSWEHGEALRRWHNADYGQPNAKGTLNPALVTIRTDEA
jgi:hypothetical protein